jgi:epoxide hydrolase
MIESFIARIPQAEVDDLQHRLAMTRWAPEHRRPAGALPPCPVDSPAGLLGWNAQLFDEALDDEFVLANVTLYWLTGTAGTSIRHYYEDTHATAKAASGPATVPIGLAAAADGDFRSIRRFAARDHASITSWNELPGVTGHYSAHTDPDQLAADIRGFFRPLRPLRPTATPATATNATATTKEI